MRHWRVLFGRDGAIKSVTEIQGQRGRDWIVVEAETEALARKKAFNAYCALKKRERIKKLAAEGRCKCGRKRDVEGQLGCSVCIERMHGYRAARKKREADGTAETHVRDETARIEVFQARHRERTNEVRLQVLLEVRQWWLEAANNGAFTSRLAAEILSASGREPSQDIEAQERAAS